MAKVKLLLTLTILSTISSCTSLEDVRFSPDFYEFVTNDGGYIVDESGKDKYRCDEPRIRTNFAALHKNKIKELANILRNAKVPKKYNGKAKEILRRLDETLDKMK